MARSARSRRPATRRPATRRPATRRPATRLARPLALLLAGALAAAPGGARALGQAQEPGIGAGGDAVAECDRLAGWATDPQRLGAPTAGAAMDAAGARAACVRAVAERPDLARLRFQLARAMWRLQDHEIAYALLEQSAQQGSPAAYLVLGRMFETGDHVRRDDVVALLHYLEAARRGAPEGMRAAAAIWDDPASPSHDPAMARSVTGRLDPAVMADW